MKRKKFAGLFLSFVLAGSLLVGCENNDNSKSDMQQTASTVEEEQVTDLDALGQYDAGNYAYWLAAGISVDYTQEDIENCIQLFCTENLSESN